jgi:hypothetical protein
MSPELELLRQVQAELRELRAQVSQLLARPQVPTPGSQAVTVDAARALLGCGRSQIFALIKSGALKRASKVGRQTMITLSSLEALQGQASQQAAPRAKEKPARRTTGQAEKEAILKLIQRKR